MTADAPDTSDVGSTPASPPSKVRLADPPPIPVDHKTWWLETNDVAVESHFVESTSQATAVYSDADALASLRRALLLVTVFTACGVVIALLAQGWRGAVALAVGAAISGSGLWEWRRLTVALTARMQTAEQPAAAAQEGKRQPPSIAFAVAGFAVRLFVVIAVLYVSLSYLHGSVAALAAGLLMGVFALTIEGVRLLRSGSI